MENRFSPMNPKNKSTMNNRILNGLAWTLLFTASVLAITGVDTDINEHLVMLLVFILATASIPLFWYGGYNCRSCDLRKRHEDKKHMDSNG